MRTWTTFVDKALDQSPLTEFLLSTHTFLSWLRHIPLWLLWPFCSLCPLLFDMSVFGIPSFPGHRDRPGLLSFLGQTSHKGSGASFPGSTGCSYVHTASGTRCLPSRTCVLVCTVFLRWWHAKWKEPRDPNSSSPPLKCKTPFYLPGT